MNHDSDDTNDELGGQVIPLGLRAADLLPAHWHQLSPAGRIEALIEHPQAHRLVPALPADEFFHMVKATGVDVAIELLPFVSPEQWQTFVDLDGWEEEETSLQRLEGWLLAAEEADVETAKRLLDSIDEEYLVSILQTEAKVHERDFDPDFSSDESDLFQSPDGEFWIEMPRESANLGLVRRALHHIFSVSLEKGRRLLRASLWELPTELVFTAQRFRQGRLADLGYPDWEEAMELLYAPVDVAALRARATAETQAGPIRRFRVEDVSPTGLAPLGPALKTPLLSHALGQIEDEEVRSAFAEGVVALAHAFCMAHKRDISEWDEHLFALERVYGYVNLGLWDVSQGSERIAADAIVRLAPAELYRAGAAPVRALAKRAAAVRRRAGGAEALSRFGTPAGESIAMLLLSIPSAFGGCDQDGLPLPEPFRLPDQLRAAQQIATEAEAVLEYFATELGVEPARIDGLEWPGISESDRAELRYDALFLTALGHRLLRGAWALKPLSPAEVAATIDQLLAPREIGGEMRPLRPEVLRMLELQQQRSAGPASEYVGAFVRRALGRLADELGGLPDGAEPNPNLLAGILLVSSAS